MTPGTGRLSNYGFSVLFLLCASLMPLQEAAATEVKLLSMGNSYTDYYDLPAFVNKLAVADGYAKPLIVTDLQGGA